MNAGSRMPPLSIAITTGEPAGVGPELTVAALAEAAQRWPSVQFTVLGDRELMAERAGSSPWLSTGADIEIEHHALSVPVTAGKLNAANGRYVLGLLDAAIDGAVSGRFDAIVTAPLQKSTINDAGVPFTGHTEYLAERTHTPRVVMMLAGMGDRPLRVALATTHLPLKDVSAALTVDGIVETLSIIDRDLKALFGLQKPRILVTGLNPHALLQARALGIDAPGPYPADTLFQPRYLKDADCVLAMFHDQGLPVLKFATFGEGINITLGLPIIRTSVDHGTALDLAGTGRADPGSLMVAIDTAVAMARHRRAA
jgi:4-hydroxythreonine-4-phosphate dehydrogenase